MTTRFTFILNVETDTAEHAEQVVGERLGHDEDYGFDYSVYVTDADTTEDTASSASRQHYIDTGRYLTHAEAAEAAELS